MVLVGDGGAGHRDGEGGRRQHPDRPNSIMVLQIRRRSVFQICADRSSTMTSPRRRLRRKVTPSIPASDRIPTSVVAARGEPQLVVGSLEI